MFGSKKKMSSIIILIIATMCFVTGTTYALLVSLAGPVENTFTIGNVEISLTETTGVDYSMIPGKEITKDPYVTVKGGSESCWLYVKVDKTAGFDDYLSFEMADGWAPLDGHNGVYYRSVFKANGSQAIGVLKDDVVVVSSALTEEKMSLVTTPKLSFKAYAIQAEGIETALDGWAQFSEGGDDR